MPDTTNFGWTKPTVGDSENQWATILNTLFDDIDADLKASITGMVKLDDLTLQGDLFLGGSGIGYLTRSSTDEQVEFWLSSPAQKSAVIYLMAASIARWAIFKENTAESGGPTGSTGADLNISRFTNAGSLIDYAVKISRSLGTTTLRAPNAPLILDRNTASGQVAVLQAARQTVIKWMLGLGAADEFALLDAAGVLRLSLALAAPTQGMSLRTADALKVTLGTAVIRSQPTVTHITGTGNYTPAIDVANVHFVVCGGSPGGVVTINTPTGMVNGSIFTLAISNNTGGAIGTLTLNLPGVDAADFVKPANGKHTSRSWVYTQTDGGSGDFWLPLGAQSPDTTILFI